MAAALPPAKSFRKFEAKSFRLRAAGKQSKAIEAFFSRSVARNVVERVLSSPVDLLPQGGEQEEIVGCASFVDLSGFTRVCDEYSAKGDSGIEYLWTLINGFFERQLAIISEFGGVPISFSGDAVLSLWIGDGNPEPGSAEEEEMLRKCCASAARCGLEMQRAFTNDRGGGGNGAKTDRRGSAAGGDLSGAAAAAAATAALNESGGLPSATSHAMRRTGSTIGSPGTPSKAPGALSLKITLASGRFTAFHLGGKKERKHVENEEGDDEETLLNIEGRFLYFVSGAPLMELGVLDKYVRAGQVLAAASAWRHLRGAFSSNPLPIAGPGGAVEAAPGAAGGPEAGGPFPGSVPQSEQATPRRTTSTSTGPTSPSAGGSGFAYVVTGYVPGGPAIPQAPPLDPLQLEGRICPPFLALYAPSFVRRRVADMIPKTDYEDAAPAFVPALEGQSPSRAGRPASGAESPAPNATLPLSGGGGFTTLVSSAVEEQQQQLLLLQQQPTMAMPAGRRRGSVAHQGAAAASAQSAALYAEFRRLCVLFVSLTDLALEARRLQTVATTLFELSDTYGGHVLKFIFDDKGVVVIIAHGLVATEDDAMHAVLNGLDIAKEMGGLGVSASIGISTGDVFCGLVGSAGHLRQFDIFSSSVNLSARLMSKGASVLAAGGGARKREGIVLIDSATLDATLNQIDAEYMGLVPLKGKAQPVAVYQVKKPKKTSLRSTASAMTSGLVGRVEERRILADAVQNLALRSGDNPEAESPAASGGEEDEEEGKKKDEEEEAEAMGGLADMGAEGPAMRGRKASGPLSPGGTNGFGTPRAMGEEGTPKRGTLQRARSSRRGRPGFAQSEASTGAAEASYSVILIEGEPGIGKTTLVGYALEQAEDTGVDFIVAGQGLAHRRTVQYHAFAPVLQALLEDLWDEATAAAAAPATSGANRRWAEGPAPDIASAIARTVAAIGLEAATPVAGGGPSHRRSASGDEGALGSAAASVRTRSAQSTGLMASLAPPPPGHASGGASGSASLRLRAAMGAASPRAVSPRVEGGAVTPDRDRTESPRPLRHTSQRISVTSNSYGARMSVRQSVRHSSATPNGSTSHHTMPAAPAQAAVSAALLGMLSPDERRAMHFLVELLSTSDVGLLPLVASEHAPASGADSTPHSAAPSMKHGALANISQGRLTNPAVSMAASTGAGPSTHPNKSSPAFNATLASIAAALASDAAPAHVPLAATRANLSGSFHRPGSLSGSSPGAAGPGPRGEARNKAVDVLVVSLFRKLAAKKTALLVLEELHAFDTRSLALLAALVSDMPPSGLLIVATTRPLPEEDPSRSVFAVLTASPHARLVPLGPLGPEDAAPLVARALGVRRRFLPKALADFIYAKSAGQPHFTVELAQSIARIPGVLEVSNGRCTILQPLTNVTVPDNLKGALTSKVDRLPPVLASALKIASVLGQRFRASALASLQRSAEGGGFSDGAEDGYDESQVNEILEGLVQAGCLQDVSDEGLDEGPGAGAVGEGAAYEFSSALLVEVAYGLLSPSMRRVLHAAAARYIEAAVLAAADEAAAAAGESGPAAHWDAWARAAGSRALPGNSRYPHLYPLLSYHYHLAEEYPRAIDYLEKEGEHALSIHASAEVLRIYTTIMELADALSRGIGDPDGDAEMEAEGGPNMPRTSSTEIVSKPQSRNQSRRRLPSGLQSAMRGSPLGSPFSGSRRQLVPLGALAKAAAEAAGGVGGGERRASQPLMPPNAAPAAATPGRGLGPAWRLRSARWLRFLATAQVDLGLFEAAEASLCRALELLGRPVPASPFRLRLAVAVGAARQRFRHMLGPFHRRRAGALLAAACPTAPAVAPEPPAAARDDPFWLVSLGGPGAAEWERAAVLCEAASVHERRCAGLLAAGSSLQLSHAALAGANAAEDALLVAGALDKRAPRAAESGGAVSPAAMGSPPPSRGALNVVIGPGQAPMATPPPPPPPGLVAAAAAFHARAQRSRAAESGARLYATLAGLLRVRGHTRRAGRYREAALSAASEAGLAAPGAPPSALSAAGAVHFAHGAMLMADGAHDDASIALTHAMERSRASGDQRLAEAAGLHLATLRWAFRAGPTDAEAAVTLAREILESAEARSDANSGALARALWAATLVASGRGKDAEEALRPGGPPHRPEYAAVGRLALAAAAAMAAGAAHAAAAAVWSAAGSGGVTARFGGGNVTVGSNKSDRDAARAVAAAALRAAHAAATGAPRPAAEAQPQRSHILHRGSGAGQPIPHDHANPLSPDAAAAAVSNSPHAPGSARLHQVHSPGSPPHVHGRVSSHLPTGSGAIPSAATAPATPQPSEAGRAAVPAAAAARGEVPVEPCSAPVLAGLCDALMDYVVIEESLAAARAGGVPRYLAPLLTVGRGGPPMPGPLPAAWPALGPAGATAAQLAVEAALAAQAAAAAREREAAAKHGGKAKRARVVAAGKTEALTLQLPGEAAAVAHQAAAAGSPHAPTGGAELPPHEARRMLRDVMALLGRHAKSDALARSGHRFLEARLCVLDGHPRRAARALRAAAAAAGERPAEAALAAEGLACLKGDRASIEAAARLYGGLHDAPAVNRLSALARRLDPRLGEERPAPAQAAASPSPEPPKEQNGPNGTAPPAVRMTPAAVESPPPAPAAPPPPPPAEPMSPTSPGTGADTARTDPRILPIEEA